jgi:probable rRNA maturation factor
MSKRAALSSARGPRRHRIAVVVAAPEWPRRLRGAVSVARRAAYAALRAGRARPAGEVSVVLGDNRLSRRLNRTWRGKDKPTNVLSFPATDSVTPKAAPLLLGDVVIAGGVVAAEATAQGKRLSAHLTHLVVHGVLHLLGHDHERDADARRMEALEVRILRGLGVRNPYEEVPFENGLKAQRS